MSYDHWKTRSPDDALPRGDCPASTAGLDIPCPKALDEINKRFARLGEHYERLLMAGQITERVYDAGLRELYAWYDGKLSELESRT